MITNYKQDYPDFESPYKRDELKGRRKIKIEFIKDKSKRQITFSKRKAGIMKKAYELSTLTGTQVLLLVASETGHVYTFATNALQPLITSAEGKQMIQNCLNAGGVNTTDVDDMTAFNENDHELDEMLDPNDMNDMNDINEMNLIDRSRSAIDSIDLKRNYGAMNDISRPHTSIGHSPAVATGKNKNSTHSNTFGNNQISNSNNMNEINRNALAGSRNGSSNHDLINRSASSLGIVSPDVSKLGYYQPSYGYQNALNHPSSHPVASNIGQNINMQTSQYPAGHHLGHHSLHRSIHQPGQQYGSNPAPLNHSFGSPTQITGHSFDHTRIYNPSPVSHSYGSQPTKFDSSSHQFESQFESHVSQFEAQFEPKQLGSQFESHANQFEAQVNGYEGYDSQFQKPHFESIKPSQFETLNQFQGLVFNRHDSAIGGGNGIGPAGVNTLISRPDSSASVVEKLNRVL